MNMYMLCECSYWLIVVAGVESHLNMQLVIVVGVTGTEPHLCMQLIDLCIPRAEVLPPV